jgi:hypothetical protein
LNYTYVVGSIVSAVKIKFADSPRHLDVCWPRRSNQHSYTRHVNQRQPIHARKEVRHFSAMKCVCMNEILNYFSMH